MRRRALILAAGAFVALLAALSALGAAAPPRITEATGSVMRGDRKSVV